MRKANIGICTILDPNAHGGLETYIRTLTCQLQERGYAVSWNGASPPDSPDMLATWQPRIDRLLPLMTRSLTHWLARLIAETLWISECEKATRNCDVVHIVGVGWNLLGFPVMRAAHRRSAVATCWPAIHPRECGDSALDLALYRRMDALFTQSNYEKDLLLSKGIRTSQVVRCDLATPNIANGSADRFRRRFPNLGKHVLLFVGRKTTAKGYHALRSAVRQLDENGRSITLVSIGKPIERRYPPLRDIVDLDLGIADEETKQDALAACDILVVPSNAESFGLVYTEAWAYKKPVICGEAPASRELVNRFHGGLTSSSDVSHLTQQISILLDDVELRLEMGHSGFDAVSRQLSWNNAVETHIATWARLNIKSKSDLIWTS